MDSLTFRLRIFLAIMVGVLLVGTVGFTLAEGLPLYDAIYFSIVTITTVGYGDISPQTQLGKVLAIFLIIGGVGTFMAVVANVTEVLIARRERTTQLQKLYAVEGIFFSELGSDLLLMLIQGDPERERLASEFKLKDEWKPADFQRLESWLKQYDYQVDLDRVDLDQCRQFLLGRSNLLLRLLENPFLIDKDSFTECLRAVFHLKDELYHRQGINPLPPTDQAHLQGDCWNPRPLKKVWKSSNIIRTRFRCPTWTRVR